MGCISLSCFAETKTLPPSGGWWHRADHKHIDLRLAGIRKLTIKIPETSPCYLTTSQSKECPGIDHATCLMLPLKTLAWKPRRSSGPLSISYPFSFLGALQINAVLSFITTWGQQIGFAALWATEPEFGSVTLYDLEQDAYLSMTQ